LLWKADHNDLGLVIELEVWTGVSEAWCWKSRKTVLHVINAKVLEWTSDSNKLYACLSKEDLTIKVCGKSAKETCPYKC